MKLLVNNDVNTEVGLHNYTSTVVMKTYTRYKILYKANNLEYKFLAVHKTYISTKNLRLLVGDIVLSTINQINFIRTEI